MGTRTFNGYNDILMTKLLPVRYNVFYCIKKCCIKKCCIKNGTGNLLPFLFMKKQV